MVIWDGNNPASELCSRYVPDYSFCTDLWKKLAQSPNFTYVFDPSQPKLNYSSILPHPSKTSSAASLWIISSSYHSHLILAIKVMLSTLIELLLCWQFSLSSTSILLFHDNHPKVPSSPSSSLSTNQCTLKNVIDPGR